MKKAFLTGVGVLLPIIVTYMIVKLLINLLSTPFFGIIQNLIIYFNVVESPELASAISLALSIVFLLAIILLIGFLGQSFVSNTLYNTFDRLMHQIPLANKVYKAVQDMLHILFSQDQPLFSNPALVPFPDQISKSVGFLINEKIPFDKDYLCSIYIPASPNPLSGLLLFIPKDKLIPLEASAEEMIKFTTSCGLITKTSHV